MIQFSQRQLDLIKTPVLDKLLILYKFYLISFMICLVAAATGLAFLIISVVKSCSYEQIHIFTLISIIFYISLIGDMLLSEKATLKFFNENCNNSDLTQNLTFKTFLQSVERLRYYSNAREVSVFQVREVLWNSMQIRFHKFFFLCQVVCWILYGISFFFAINQIGKGCIHKHESLIIFVIYLYHNFWFILIVGFSVVVSVSAILFLPFLVCAYFKYNNKSDIPTDPDQQKKVFLQTQLENFKYDSAKAKDTLCAICLEDFQSESPVKRTKCCRSIYHQVCIQEWVSNSITCPNCRKSPFTKNKGQDGRLDTVEPLNSNNQNNQQIPQNQGIQPENLAQRDDNLNQVQENPNQEEQNPPQDDQNPLQEDQNQNQMNPNENKTQDQDQISSKIQIDKQQQEQFSQNDQNKFEDNPKLQQIQQEGELTNINTNQKLQNKQVNQNAQEEESYVIQFSDKSLKINSRKNSIEINNSIIIQYNNCQNIQFTQENKQFRQNQQSCFEFKNISNTSTSNRKQKRKNPSTNTQGIINNNFNSELHGQRLTINNNTDLYAANSTEISTQKVTINTKQMDFQSSQTNGFADQYDVVDFDNIHELKEDIDMR